MKRIIYFVALIALISACKKSEVMKDASLDTHFTFTGALYPDSVVQFTANEEPNRSYHWHFSDGSGADGPVTTYLLPFKSVLSVTLTVTNLDSNTSNNGESNSGTKKLVLQVANGLVGDYHVSKMIFDNSTWPHSYVTVSIDTIHISATDEQALLIMGAEYYGDEIESGGYKKFTSSAGNSVHFYNNDSAFDLEVYPYVYLGSRL